MNLHPKNKKYRDKLDFYSKKLDYQERVKTSNFFRKKNIEKQFHPYDGSHIVLEKRIKASMNDPDSYKHVETKHLDRNDYILVTTKFRGKNSFGGVVMNSVTAKVDTDGEILEIIK